MMESEDEKIRTGTEITGTEVTGTETKEPKAKIKIKPLCALVIGHKKSKPGAKNNSTGLTEFDFNDDLSQVIEDKVKKARVKRIYRRTYTELPSDINVLGPGFIVSLHCNAFNETASGSEVLYYHKSSKGKKVAGILLDHLVKHLKLPDRGIKPRTAEERGGHLLRYTKAPCVIAEPFFIDNDSDGSGDGSGGYRWPGSCLCLRNR